MEISVDDLSKLAKVSVRTLHYYDEIDLLKPAFRKGNGRRFYDMEQLLMLFDVIFFKRLGFNLKKIKYMLMAKNLDKRALMATKKQFLQNELRRIEELITTIDKTDFYLKGENLNFDEIGKQFELFHKNRKEDKLLFEREYGKMEEDTEKLKKMSFEEQKKCFEDKIKHVDRELYAKKAESCVHRIMEAMNQNKREDSKEVQDLMKEYFEIVSMIQPMSKKKWLGISVAIGNDRDIYTLYAKIAPKLPEFLANAIKIYGDKIK